MTMTGAVGGKRGEIPVAGGLENACAVSKLPLKFARFGTEGSPIQESVDDDAA